ncbi:MAG TPA: glycosyltransferase 87 family protein, partial [Puia sp.]
MSERPEKIEPLKPINYRVVLNIVVLLIILSHSIIRDVYLEKQYTGDLRNRIVGARLQKDGRLPYFYYWQAKDGIRYFDPINTNKSSETVSPITASPFFHQLLYPICDLDQKSLSKIWFAFQYILLVAMIWIACRMTSDGRTRWLMVNTAVLFTMTEAWKSIIVNGQIYLFYAFLMLCVISRLLNNKKGWKIIGGLILAVWILNRPIGLIVMVPILLLYKQQRVFIFSTIAGLMGYGLFVLSSPFEKSLWLNYADGL